MKKITKLRNIIVFSSLCAIVTGCASTKVVSESSEVNKLIDERSLISVSVYSSKNTELSTAICNNAETYLAQNKYCVTKDNADLVLKLDVEESVYDEAGEYVILDGTLSNVLTTYDNSIVLARMPECSARSKRTLGDVVARRELTKKLSNQLQEWMEQEISPDILEIESRNITIFRNFGLRKNDAAYIREFISKVEKIKGVYAVTLIKHDVSQRNFVVNIILSTTEIPEGISNRIMATYPELKLKY